MKYARSTTVITVVFVFAGVMLNLAFFGNTAVQDTFRKGSVLGGPDPARAQTLLPGVERGFLETTYPIEQLPIAFEQETVVGVVVLDSAAVLNTANPLGVSLPDRDGLLIYKVQEGDNLSTIAAEFGISLSTILWANDTVRANLITPGQELVILPISGVLHKTAPGETIDTIAGLYGISPEKIIKTNPKLETLTVTEGEKIIIPGAEPNRTVARSSRSRLPNLNSYFVLPTTGWNWGDVHPDNAVDIANACGTPVYASAEGLVVKTGSPLNWNGGRGGNVEIEHPNRTATSYAHLQTLTVSLGDYVSQGEQIGKIGNTGNTRGVTGCHLHFGVDGAQNPLAK